MNGTQYFTARLGVDQQREQAFCGERRALGERRRNAGGLFEMRARREGVGGDRRRRPRVATVVRRRIRGLWRRVKPH